MQPANTPSDPVLVEYDNRGSRAIMGFYNHAKGKSFFALKDKQGKNPKVVKATEKRLATAHFPENAKGKPKTAKPKATRDSLLAELADTVAGKGKSTTSRSRVKPTNPPVMHGTTLRLGDCVSVVCGRKRVTAVVAGTHYLQRRGKNQRLAQLVTGDKHSLDREMLVLVSMTDTAWYRISPTDATIRKEAKGSVDPCTATRRLDEVKKAIKSSRSERQWDRYEESRDSGLTRLNHGDAIEVEFRGGTWHKATFQGFVRGSGNVRFEYNGRKRTCSPKFVRVAS